MSEAVTRAELEAYDRDELIDFVLELQREQEEIRDEIAEIKQHAGTDRAKIRKMVSEKIDELEDEIQEVDHVQHKERGKLARRVTEIEDELGVAAVDAIAIAEGEEADGYTRLGRLMRVGPEAVVENPTAKMYRAKVIADKFDRWAQKSKKHGIVERRLASSRDDVKTRIEDERDENLAWRQVYRAMELVAEWSDGGMALREGGDKEGKYVLVHRMEVDDR